VPIEEELRRVIPVIRELAAGDAVVSVDTMRAEVADAALAAGAALVNDVSGGLADPAMAGLVAEAGVPFVAMHWRAPSAEMESRAVYDDVVIDVSAELAARLEQLVEAGVDPQQVVLDPGLGFAKNAVHNWALLADLDALHALGRPLLLGASRKRFLGSLLAGPDGEPAPVEARDAATAAISTLAALAGVWCVRVHEVRSSVDAVGWPRRSSPAGVASRPTPSRPGRRREPAARPGRPGPPPGPDPPARRPRDRPPRRAGRRAPAGAGVRGGRRAAPGLPRGGRRRPAERDRRLLARSPSRWPGSSAASRSRCWRRWRAGSAPPAWRTPGWSRST
jgi:dihydropteroate synthase